MPLCPCLHRVRAKCSSTRVRRSSNAVCETTPTLVHNITLCILLISSHVAIEDCTYMEVIHEFRLHISESLYSNDDSLSPPYGPQKRTRPCFYDLVCGCIVCAPIRACDNLCMNAMTKLTCRSDPIRSNPDCLHGNAVIRE